MRKLSTSLFTALMAATITACSSSPTSPSDPATVTLATIDTRCPANAFCIQMGDAYVKLEASLLAGSREFELQALNPTKRSTTHGPYSIELKEVSPYPFGQPISPADYRVTLRVAKDIEPAGSRP